MKLKAGVLKNQYILLSLFAAGLLFWSSLAALLPTLPLYMEDVGATKQQIGIVLGCFAIGMLLFRSFFGRLADQRGRKIVLIIGMLVNAIAPLGYILVQSIPGLMAVRAFHGLSIAAFTTGFLALVADLAPEKNRGEIMGYMSLVTPIGTAIGPALGGYLQATSGYTLLFLLSTGLAGMGLLCLVPIVNPPIHKQNKSDSDSSKFWRLLFSPRVRVLASIMLMIGLAFGALHTFVPLFIKAARVDLNPGLFYTAGALASFSVRFFTGKASDRYGRGLFITLSLVVYAISMMLLAFATTANVFLIAGTLEGAGSGILMPMISTVIADRSLQQERGRVFSLCIMGLDFGIAIAGPIFGSVAEQVGYRNMFGFCAGLAILALLIFLTQGNKNFTDSLRFALGRGKDAYSLNQS
ncbi:major facilitator superfamily protein [Tolypothrix tenuis PCC 7101]|uniref:Major facilitator superfamily protein n=1 Tax=Tolypothrix tenuis PCC 7101 TaxID=231146 RepID=A0A1Z4MXV1_9CYAN|nr:MFS transporter [Aulosira sp. FACHB-113]BAY98314.1 major facilitator superfamily protein [Tolypothrix tenuis PCC 7101]BAZ77767.1 major facilitator superfamily protein [Aulosira laxa NIES-50]